MIPHIFRLNPGQDLYLELQKYVQEKKIEAAILHTLIGSLAELQIRLAGAKEFLHLKEELEILQVSGTLSRSGMHLHGSFSKKNGSIVGGHLKPGCLVRTTAEVVLFEIPDWQMARHQDQTTGFRELFAKKTELS